MILPKGYEAAVFACVKVGEAFYVLDDPDYPLAYKRVKASETSYMFGYIEFTCIKPWEIVAVEDKDIRLTWKEFKDKVESRGVVDSDRIAYIDISDDGAFDVTFDQDVISIY
jgi:hypothetical protein